MSLMYKIRLMFSSVMMVFICGIAYPFSMNIDPPRVELDISPGEESGGYISVSNNNETDQIHVKVYLNDLIYLPDGSNDFLPSGTTPWSMAGWVKVGPTEFDLPPGEEMKVRYIANIPEDVEGGRYGVVFFEVSPPLRQVSTGAGATMNIRLGSVFLITVNGTEKLNTELQGMNVSDPDENGAFEVECNIRNSSNVLVRPNGPIKIINSSKTEVAKLNLNESKTGVFPGTNRKFSVKYEGSKLAPGEYFVQAILDYGGETYIGGQTTLVIK